MAIVYGMMEPTITGLLLKKRSISAHSLSCTRKFRASRYEVKSGAGQVLIASQENGDTVGDDLFIADSPLTI